MLGAASGGRGSEEEEEEKRSMISPPSSPPVEPSSSSPLVAAVAQKENIPSRLDEDENDPLLLGTGATAATTTTTHTPDQGGSLNARFGYVGRLAHRFLEQVAGDSDEDDDDDDASGWNVDDGLDELGDSSQPATPSENNVSPSVSTSATSFGTAKSEDDGEEEEVVVLVEEQATSLSPRAETPLPEEEPADIIHHHSPSGSFATARHEDDYEEEEEIVNEVPPRYPDAGDGHSEYHDPSEHNTSMGEDNEEDLNVLNNNTPVAIQNVENLPAPGNALGAPETFLLVDMVPKASTRSRKDAHGGRGTKREEQDHPSLIVQAELEDLTRDSGRTDDIDDDRVYDNEDELNFGPVVDVIPKPSPLVRRFDSLAVQAGRGDEDEDLDNDDERYDADGTEAECDSALESHANTTDDRVDNVDSNNNVVDHLPEDRDEDDKKTSNLSVGVLASLGDEDCDTFVNTRDDSFGPVVDVTPMEEEQKQNPQTPSGSLAVNAADIERDMAEEEEMEYATTTVQGSIMDETEGGMIVDQDEDVVSGWDEDTDMDDDTKDEKLDGDTTPKKRTETKKTTFSVPLHVIDHLPPELQRQASDEPHATIDPSTAALATSEDMSRDTGDGNDEEVYDDENELEYGPVVDHTPAPDPTVSASQIGTDESLAVNAQALQEDIKEDEAMDDDEVSTDVASGYEGRSQENSNAISACTSTSRTSQKVVLVDQTPSAMGSSSPVKKKGVDQSVEVLASLATSRETGDADSTAGGRVVYGQVVDHTPATPAASMLVRSDSVVVQGVDNASFHDDSTDVIAGGTGDGWDHSAESLIDDGSKIDEASLLRSSPHPDDLAVVDHTPAEIDGVREEYDGTNDPSIGVLASEVNTRDSGDVDSTGELAVFGPVVDQTPHTPAATTSSQRSESVLVQCADDNTYDDDESTPAASLLGRSDSVVAQGADDSSFHDDSTDVATGGGDGCGGPNLLSYTENETGRKIHSVAFDVRRDVTLVDHTPSEMDERVVLNGDPSLEVLASETDTRETEDADSTGEQHVVYGPVVDQTPMTPATLSSLARSDSVVVQIHDEIDTIDETTIPFAISKEEGDTINGDETAADTRSTENEDQLVDHIPTGSASRYGDASTLVAAEPSEVISEVDDMGPEEQNYGPVVDQTPRLSVVLPQEPSEAGSTGVFAPASLAADDLDEEVADGAEDQEVWNPDDHLEEAPNPQSGNDEAVTHIRFGEQLVDFLPPPNEDAEEEDTNRDVMSEMAVGGAPSLLPDAIEDDFGPVVDQLPTSSSCLHSHESTSTQVTASECRSLENDDKINGRQDEAVSEQARNEIVVDQLPLSRGRTRQDSVATVTRSQISEDEEDASKFGPVVDQLPTSRASFAPSRGGSTVDALGTVSEVNSDDDGEGWDDDADFDTSTAGVSEVRISALSVNASLAASSSHDRNTSVRFDASAGDLLSVGKSSVQPSSVEHKQGSEQVETHIIDAGFNHAGTDDSLLLSTAARCFAEAETPPSTPYRRANIEIQTEKKDETSEISVPRLGGTRLSYSHCEPCCNANGVDCPCVRRLLDGSMVDDMKDIDGTIIKVDFSQLWQDEMTRRKLLEEEMVALKSLLASDLSKCKVSSSREQELEAEILDMKTSQDSLSLDFFKSENKAARLLETNESLREELRVCRCSLAELTENRDILAMKDSALMSELQTLKDSLSQVILDSSLEENQRDMTASLLKDLATKTGECEELKANVDMLQMHREENVSKTEEILALKNTVDDLKYQLVQSDLIVKDTENARIDLEMKLQSLECEVANLRSTSGPLAKQVADLQILHEKELQQNYKLLDKKTDYIQNLEKAVSLFLAEKRGVALDLARQHSLAEQSESLANELIAVAKERDVLEESLRENREALVALQRHIEDHGSEHRQLHSKKDQELAALQERVTELTEALESKEVELSDLKNLVDSLTQERDHLLEQIAETEIILLDLQNEVDTSRRTAEDDKKKLIESQEVISSLGLKVEYLTAESVHLQVEAKESATQAAELKDKLHSIEETSRLLSERSKELERNIHDANQLNDSLSKELDDVKSKNNNLLAKCDEMENQYAKSLIDFEAKAQQLSLEYEEDLVKFRETSDQLQEEVVRLQEAETHHAYALEEVEKSAEEEMKQHEELTQKLKSECSQLREELSSYKENIEILSRALRDLESEKAELLRQNNEGNVKLSTEGERLQQELSLYQVSAEKATESLGVLQKKYDEQSREYESKSTRLVAECESLKNELRLASEKESDFKLNLESVKEDILRQKADLENLVETVKAECDDLRKQVEHHRSISEELVAERDRLGEVEREIVMIGEENEELLIQLALLKQQKDESEQIAKQLKTELKMLEQKKQMENDPELERLQKAHSDQQRHEELMIKNKELEATIHSLSGKDSESQKKIFQLTEDCNRREKALQSKDVEIKSLLDETGKESMELKRQLVLTQEKLLATETSLETKKQVIELVKELELKVRELESQLEEKECNIGELTMKLSDMEKQFLSAASSKVELEALCKQTESLSEALQLTRRRLSQKEEDVDRLSTELRNLKTKQSQEATKVATEAISHHFTEAKRGIALTKNVLDKAFRLKRSDSMRAQAIHQLQRDRELNAENVRRLRDVVEKFYS